MPSSFYPITFPLHDDAGAPIVGSTKLMVSVAQMPSTSDPASGLAVDLVANPPVPKLAGLVDHEEPMVDLYIDETQTVVLSSTETDLQRLNVKESNFACQVHVVDEEQTVAASQITLDNLPVESIGVVIFNTVTSSALVEGTHFTVDYGTGVVTFSSGASTGHLLEATYRYLAVKDTDYSIDGATGIFTRITLGDIQVTFVYEYVWSPGYYIYMLDVSGLPDGRYRICVSYRPGGSPTLPDKAIVRFGKDDFMVKSGLIVEDLITSQAGNGPARAKLQTRDDADVPGIIGDVQLSIFDAEGDRVLTATRTGETTGDVEIGLVPGTYTVVPFKAFTSWTLPINITVTDSAELQTFTLTGTIVSNTLPDITGNGCAVVYGNIQTLGCDPIEGVAVRARVLKPPHVDNGVAYLESDKCVTTDASGNFSISLVRGAVVRFEIVDAGFREVRTIPDQDSVRFDELE